MVASTYTYIYNLTVNGSRACRVVEVIEYDQRWLMFETVETDFRKVFSGSSEEVRRAWHTFIEHTYGVSWYDDAVMYDTISYHQWEVAS